MKVRQLTTCVFHSGKCLYRLVACACRNSIPNACNLSTVSNVEKFLLGSAWLRNKILFVEPICQQSVSRMNHGENWSSGPSAILKIEKSLRHLIGKMLCPVPLQTVLKILSPFGHSWNMLQDEDLEDQDEVVVTCDEVAHSLNLGTAVD